MDDLVDVDLLQGAGQGLPEHRRFDGEAEAGPHIGHRIKKAPRDPRRHRQD